MTEEAKNIMKEKTILVYGATGYTGKIICLRLKELGLKFTIAGRDGVKIKELAQELTTDFHILQTDDLKEWKSALENVTCLINAAGPFLLTAEDIINACIINKVHYLDISAEIPTYQMAESYDAEAKKAGIMIMAGAGLFVSYDAMVIHTLKRISNPTYLSVGFRHFGGFSRGSVLSSKHISDLGILIRKDHVLIVSDDQSPKVFDSDEEKTEYLPTSLGGTIISYKSAGIPNINEYFQLKMPATTMDISDVANLPDGPTEEERNSGRNKLMVEARNAENERVVSSADLPSGYSLTPLSVAAVAKRVVNGEFKVGNQTPGTVFGEEILDDIPTAVISDIK